MKSSAFYFFATRADLAPVIDRVEKEEAVSYLLLGEFVEQKPLAYETGLSLPNLGTSLTGDKLTDARYLVVVKGAQIEMRSVQRKGGVHHILDPLSNPESVVFSPGGTFGEGALIGGDVGTVYHNPVSQRLFKAFRACFNGFSDVKGNLIGEEALKLLDRGARLTPSVRWSRAVDLTKV